MICRMVLAILVGAVMMAVSASAAEPIPHQWNTGFPKFQAVGDANLKKLTLSGKIQYKTVKGGVEVIGVKYKVYMSTSPTTSTLPLDQQSYPVEPTYEYTGTLGAGAAVPGENFTQYDASGDSGTDVFMPGIAYKIEVVVTIRTNNDPELDQDEVFQTSYIRVP